MGDVDGDGFADGKASGCSRAKAAKSIGVCDNSVDKCETCDWPIGRLAGERPYSTKRYERFLFLQGLPKRRRRAEISISFKMAGLLLSVGAQAY